MNINKLSQDVSTYLKQLMCSHKWEHKRTTALFFLGKLRQTVTFYKECTACGKVHVVDPKSES